MEKGLLVVERIVLEALERRALTFMNLKEQVGFQEPLLKAILSQMIQKGIILYRDGHYEIHWNAKHEWLPSVLNKEGIKAEIKELFSSLVNQIYSQRENCTLKMQKIWLDHQEQRQLEIKLKDIEIYIEGIKERRKTKPVKEITCQKQILFYGAGPYDQLVGELIQAS